VIEASWRAIAIHVGRCTLHSFTGFLRASRWLVTTSQRRLRLPSPAPATERLSSEQCGWSSERLSAGSSAGGDEVVSESFKTIPAWRRTSWRVIVSSRSVAARHPRVAARGSPAWFVIDVAGVMDTAAFYAAYRDDGHGRAAYEPSVMIALLLYCWARGVRSSRAIERRASRTSPVA
jgi:hypothetical protein